jgi:general secretion pathway protein E
MNLPEVNGSVLTVTLLEQARRASKVSGRRLVDVLVEQSHLTPDTCVEQLAEILQWPSMTFAALVSLTPAFDLVPFVEASRRGCLAGRDGEGLLRVALSDPFDLDVQDWLESRVTERFEYGLVSRQDLTACLSRHEESLRAIDQVGYDEDASHVGGRGAEEISIESISGADSAVVRLVNSTLFDAYRAGASDIHLETTVDGLQVKYRIDGVLNLAERAIGVEFAEQVISRVKVMAELDIAERRVPQDGRFKVAIKGRDVDLRVSIMPSIFGEDAVLRILDRRTLSGTSGNITLESLGFESVMREQLYDLATQPYGMLLVTGPTGSGKTTSIYAVLTEVNTGQDKIVTIEDPVEYQLPGILQIPVNEKKGLTFARGLRSILRHDPDRIMVGEIRDPETAEIAVQSALTGHLVYTTVHANNVYDVIGRFMHMGVDLYNFVSAVNAIMAQRLIRINCPECAESWVPDEKTLRRSRVSQDQLAKMHLMRGKGCSACRGTGYRGRRAIGELLIMNDDIRELILARAPARQIRDAAYKTGTVPLRQAAVELVLRGLTTFEEINRVTFVA